MHKALLEGMRCNCRLQRQTDKTSLHLRVCCADAHLVFDLAVEAGSTLLCIVDVDLLTRGNSKQLPIPAPRDTCDTAVGVNRQQRLA